MTSSQFIPAVAIPASQPTSATDPDPGSLETGVNKPKFAKDAKGFQAELRRRVDGYFESTGKSPNDCWQMYLKTFIIMAWVFTAYFFLVFVVQSLWLAIPIALLFAIAMGGIGFDIQHDGGHSAYSKRRWVNKLSAMSLDFLGGSSYLWYWKHHIFHHTYCNITGVDADVELGSIMRLTPHQPRKRIHRFQHLYLWVLYGVMAARWHLWGDFADIAKGKIGPHKIPRPKGWDLVFFILGKSVSIGFLIVLPMFFHDWWVVLIFYVGITAVLGIYMSVVFQLAHCVEEADFPIPVEGTARMEEAWAIHQVQTSVDFARDSRIWTWLLGGLNFQIEHHLFPRICHIHYPAISKIVEATCKEYGVRYTAHPTFWAGVASHYRWLRRMGRAEVVTPPSATAAPSTA